MGKGKVSRDVPLGDKTTKQNKGVITLEVKIGTSVSDQDGVTGTRFTSLSESTKKKKTRNKKNVRKHPFQSLGTFQ